MHAESHVAQEPEPARAAESRAQARAAEEIARARADVAEAEREAAANAQAQAGRPGSVVHTPDGTMIATSPDGRTTTITEPGGNTTTILSDESGRITISEGGKTTTLPEGLPWTEAIKRLMARPEAITGVHVPPPHMSEAQEFAREMFDDAFPLIVIVIGLIATTIIGLPIARALARRIDRRVPNAAPAPELASRLDRIEQAIETMAVEVERVSESQRYAARLLTERLPEAPLRQVAGAERA